jgi:hypothetical protein
VRRPCAAVALVAYLVAALGFPLAVPAAKDRGQPFPCMNHACGCADAEQCWRHCCCFTPQEKLAWAKAHGITPPAYAERPAAQGWHTARLRDREQAETTTCACAQHRPDAKGCCETASRPVEKSSTKASTGSRWVVGVAALRCRGLTSLWLSAGAVLPPPATASWCPYWPLAGTLEVAGIAAPRLAQRPPAPPPRP